MAIAQYLGKEESLIDITVAIDKLDKIGYEKVCDELRSKGFAEEDIEKLLNVLKVLDIWICCRG